MRLQILSFGTLIGAMAVSTSISRADIPVPNGSFEGPDTTLLGGIWPDAEQWDEFGFVDNDLSKYDGLPIPPGYTISDADTLDTGVFYNSPVIPNQQGGFDPNPLFITNASGGLFAPSQLAFMFAVPQPLPGDPPIAFRQTLTETYQAGVDYDLLFNVGESYYVPLVGATMEIRLSYDDAGVLQTLASQQVSQADLPQGVQKGVLLLEDVTASLAGLEASHPAVGQPIVIEILPTVGVSGVWVFDEVRLVPEPASLALLALGGLWLTRRR